MPNPRKQLGAALDNRVVDKATGAGLYARKQPLSGVLKDFPADVVIERVLVECKVRTAQIDAHGQRYLKVDLDWKHKVDKQASESEFDAGVLVFNAKGSSTPQVIISLDYLLRLLREQKQSEATNAMLDEVVEMYLDNPPSIEDQRRLQTELSRKTK